MMDARKLDMIFFMTFENGKDLTYEEIEDIAKKIFCSLSLVLMAAHQTP